MIIKNVKIFQEDHAFHAGVIYLQDGMIEHIQPESELDGAEPIPQEGEQVIDGRGCYAIPGMIDLHFHGCMGSDVCDATEEALHTIAKDEASIGVTAISPATMTLSGTSWYMYWKMLLLSKKEDGRSSGCGIRGRAGRY